MVKEYIKMDGDMRNLKWKKNKEVDLMNEDVGNFDASTCPPNSNLDIIQSTAAIKSDTCPKTEALQYPPTLAAY